MKTTHISRLLALAVIALSIQTIATADDVFPKLIPGLTGSPPEGFTIGKRATGYSASLDGSIYKMSLRTGEGETLVDVIEPWTVETCRLLGIRIDRRTNHLFGAGCFYGNAFVYDANNGSLLMEYQLNSSGSSVINDIAVTRDAVYFTDFNQPFLYKLPLGRGGRLPEADAAIAIPLIGDIGDGVTNGIVATKNGKTLIVGNSFNSTLYRVNPATGMTDAIDVQPPLTGFLDGIAMRGRTLYIMTPATGPGEADRIQVVELAPNRRSGRLVGSITDPDMDGVASGALFRNSLYVNNARYSTFPMPNTEYVITKLGLDVDSD